MLWGYVTGCIKWKLDIIQDIQFSNLVTSGVLAGLVLGKPIEGLMIGGTIQLIYVGVIAPGGNFPTDSAIAGACVAPIALMTGMKPSVAVTLLAVPVGLLEYF